MAALDYGALRAQTLHSGRDEEAVTVNTRALIDKVLARYSGEHTMLRELLQNAADANATSVDIKFETIPTDVPDGSTKQDRLKALIKAKSKRIIVKNNGHSFREEDWQRLKRIAEGNPDEQKIGAFGVGFYSVFADCEEPFISSGSEAMAFYWKGNQLFTRRSKRDVHDPSTVFFLDNREPSDLPELKGLCRFLATSITFVSLASITLSIDDMQILHLRKKPAPALSLDIPRSINPQTTGDFMTISDVVTESVQIDAEYIELSQYTSTGVNDFTSGVQSVRSFFSKFTTPAPTRQASSQDLSQKKTATIFLRIATAEVRTSVPYKVAQELERATKKPPPKVTKIAMLSMSKAELDASEQKVEIFDNIYPNKEGKIFIGFPTHQTTSIKAHISAHSVIPTVERESIDLNARIVKMWNAELLQCAGILARIMYTDEMDQLRRSAKGKSGKELAPLYDTAIHVMNQFTFLTSTPSSEVGKYIEHGFWACGRERTIEMLSSCGVLPSNKIRISTDVTFLDDLAVLPAELEKGASTFVDTLKTYGWLTEVTVQDIRNALDKKALSKGQAISFMKWLAHQKNRNLIDNAAMHSLLEVAVVMDERADAPIQLGNIKCALDPHKFPVDIPLPPDCAPFHLTRTLSKGELDGIGYHYMGLPHWISYLCNGNLPVEKDINLNPEFAQTVLVVISKNWQHLPAPAKSEIIKMLQTKTCIVTRNGMKIPQEAYLEKIRLFEDLPIVVPYNGVKSNVLAELGVRKTVELKLILERLTSGDKTGLQWSHVDLIKYLSGVRNDIPKSDMEMLRKAPTCLAEGESERRAIKDLYQPDDSLRRLGFPVLAWPEEWRPNSQEVRFLDFLGLRKFPSATELLALASNENNEELRRAALGYFLSHFYTNGYVNTPSSDIQKFAFLPSRDATEKKLYRADEIYSNENAAIFNFPLLSRGLLEHATKFGIKEDPPIERTLHRLLASPPQTDADARKKFIYLAGRISEIGSNVRARLRNATFIPVIKAGTEKDQKIHYLSPKMCFIGGEGSPYKEIFDFVDFGGEANAFLLYCGAKSEPSISELAYMIANEPSKVLSAFGDHKKYLVLLGMIAASWGELKRDTVLVGRMKSAPMLLASREIKPASTSEKLEGADQPANIREYRLALAQDITLIDDFISYELFKNDILAAPQDDILEQFYARLGSVYLSAKIEESHVIGERKSKATLCAQLRKLIVERARLFLYSNKESVRHDYRWLEKNLSLDCVDRIKHRRDLLLNTHRLHHERSVTAAIVNRNKQPTLFVTPDYKFFDIAQALVGIMLNKPPAHASLIMESLLSTDLLELRNRGVNVDRILEARQEEARLAEELRLKKVEESRKQLIEQERQYRKEQEEREKSLSSSRPGVPESPKMPGGFGGMPGSFEDSPPRKPSTAIGTSAPQQQEIEPGGFFKRFTKRLGIDTDKKQEDQLKSLLGEDKSDSGRSTKVENPLEPPRRLVDKPTSTHRISTNLQNAIDSTRAHNSNELVSKGKTYDVKEESTYCDSNPAQNIAFVAESAIGMKLFLHKDLLPSTGDVMTAFGAAMNNFSQLLKTVAEIYNLPLASLHIFYDEQGSSIAFNANGALFFNFRFYHELHSKDESYQAKGQALVYWFTVAAHELAHNLVGPHNSEHSFYTESFVQEYFLRAAEKIPKPQS